MMKRLMVVCILLAAGAANSAEPMANGAYVGGSIGSSVFEDDGAFIGLNFDDKDQAFQAHAGYKFFRYLAVEGRYTDYGTFALESVGFDASAVSIHAVGIVPFGGSGWELFGQLGVGSLTLELGGSDEKETTFAGGLGVRFYPTQNMSLGVQTDVHVWEDDSLGFSLTPGVGATQVSLQLIF